MPCYKPLRAIRDSDGIRFVGRETPNLKLPCGQCIGCRLTRSRNWACRCMHEASLHRYNCFITVTYAPEHLPPDGSLVKRHHQLFLKRLRKAAAKFPPHNPPVGGGGILTSTPAHQDGATDAPQKAASRPSLRYYMAGEYGSKLQRPHYHFCIFGIDFADKRYWQTTGAGSKIYRSPLLEQLWPYGHSTVGELNFESAAYTARYCIKKQTGKNAKTHYERIDPETGEIYNLLPEYNEMSRGNRNARNNAIGRNWLEKYKSDVFDALPGQVLVRGKPTNAPRYYMKQLEKWDPEKYEIIVDNRIKEGRKKPQENRQSRLTVKETVTEAKLKYLKRSI